MKRLLLPLLLLLALGLILGLFSLIDVGEDDGVGGPAAETAAVVEEAARAEAGLAGRASAPERLGLAGGEASGGRIRGRIALPSGTGNDPLRVYAFPAESSARRTVSWSQRAVDREEPEREPLAAVEAASDGSFELRLPEGDRLVRIAAIGPRCWTPAPVLAQVGGPEVRLTAQLGASVEGRVLDLEGRPAAEVRVVAKLDSTRSSSLLAQYRFEAREAVTDADGRFGFWAMPLVDAVVLQVLVEDGAPLQQPLGPLAPGEVREVELRLERGSTVVGRVVDEQGAPIAGAEVQARQREPMGLLGRELRSATTGDDGRFELPDLIPDETVGQVVAEGYRSKNFNLDDLGQGRRLQLGDLVLPRGESVRGRVELPDGSPARDFEVSVQLDGERTSLEFAESLRRGSSGETRTADDGTFEIGGLEGAVFVVEAEGELDGARYLGRRGGVRAGTELTLSLGAPASLGGRVIDTAGRPVTDFTLRLERAGRSIMQRGTGSSEWSSFSSPDGNWSMEGLVPGRWRVAVRAAQYAAVPSIEVVAPQSGPIEIVLEAGRSVVGRVLDPAGRPLAGAFVRIDEPWFQRLSDGSSSQTITDEEGRFALDGLPAGELSVVAEHESYVVSEPVVVAPSSEGPPPEISLSMRVGGAIRGRAFTQEGEPFASGQVMLFDTQELRPTLHDLDADGRFEITRVVPGNYQLMTFPDLTDTLTDEGENSLSAAILGESSSVMVDVADGDQLEVDIGRPPVDPVHVTGNVVQGNDPAPNMILSFNVEGRPYSDQVMVLTDATGRFDVTLPEPGRYLVTAMTGTMPSPILSSISFQREIPDADEHRVDLELPTGSIAGRITDTGGRPLANVPVEASPSRGLVFGKPQGAELYTTISGPDGRYSFGMLRAGRYEVRAAGPRDDLRGGTDDGWGGQVVDAIELLSGQAIEDLDFALAPGATLEGQVVDEAGDAVAEAVIFARDAEGRVIDRISQVTTDATGTFRLDGLSPGEYSVFARRDDLCSPTVSGIEVGLLSSDQPDVRLVLGPGTRLVVRVEVDGELDREGSVNVFDELGRDVTHLAGLSDVLERTAEILRSDEVHVGPLAPGRYTVVARASDGRERERSVSLRGQDERRLRVRID